MSQLHPELSKFLSAQPLNWFIGVRGPKSLSDYLRNQPVVGALA